MRRRRAQLTYRFYRSHDIPTLEVRAALIQRLNRLPHRPKVSIVVPVYNARPEWVARLVRSVEDQIYPEWELILSDDGSTDPATLSAMHAAAREASAGSVRLLLGESNRGVVVATNRGASEATGEWIAFADHDDELLPTSLLWMVERAVLEQPVDVLYSDEELVPATSAVPPYPSFKPGPAPESLLAYNYMCHFVVIRKAFFHQIGGLREGTDGAQDFDLLLRAARAGARFAHVPRVLYRWHLVPCSISREVQPSTQQVRQPEKLAIATCRVVQEHLDQVGIPAVAEASGDWVRLDWKSQTPPALDFLYYAETQGRGVQELRNLLESVGFREGSLHLPDRLTTEKSWKARDRARLEWYQSVARGCHGEFLCFLDERILGFGDRWLRTMCGALTLPGVALVGSRHLDASGKVLHAGYVVDGPTGQVVAPGRGTHPDETLFGGYVSFLHNSLGVEVCGCAVRRSVFQAVGGFRPERFVGNHAGGELGIRVHRFGQRVIAVPGADLVVSKEIGSCEDRSSRIALQGDYPTFLDPFWNPNFRRQRAGRNPFVARWRPPPAT